MSIEKLKKNYPVKIRWMYFPLHPETPQEGLSLEDLFPGRDLAPMKERMKSLMAEAGLPYGDRSHTFNSRLHRNSENGQTPRGVMPTYTTYFIKPTLSTA